MRRMNYQERGQSVRARTTAVRLSKHASWQEDGVEADSHVGFKKNATRKWVSAQTHLIILIIKCRCQCGSIHPFFRFPVERYLVFHRWSSSYWPPIHLTLSDFQ